VRGPAASRWQIARALKAAYADGLLSEETFAWRIDQLFHARVIDPARLIGDLSVRSPAGWRARLADAVAAAKARLGPSEPLRDRPALLALDWSGRRGELLVGRHHACDVVLSDPSVSRRHARLVFRDGSWVLQDLESTNGTTVNGVRVGRCALRPGDLLALGDEELLID
jgi:hypothetical protein